MGRLTGHRAHPTSHTVGGVTSFSRRQVGGLVAAAALLPLAACSDAPTPAGARTTAAPKAPTSAGAAPTTPPSSVAGAPAGLAAVVTRRYAGRPMPRATATLGRWHGSQVAVVTSGGDVTLAVAAPKSSTWSIVGGWWPSLGQATPDVGGRKFVLLVGSDARVSKGQPVERSRADALQLVGMDGKGGAGIIGFARDLWVPLPGGRTGKLNSAMVFGGVAGQVSTVRTLTGLPVERYVVMSFGGFARFVDRSGGLPVVLTEPMHGKGVDLDLSAGPHVLTGAQALGYARERKSLPDGDFGRSRHQGNLMLFAAVKARLAGVAAVPAAVSALDATSESDLSAAEVLQWAAGFYVLKPAAVGRAVAKGPFGTSPDGQSIVRLDAASRAAFAKLADGRL